MTPLAHLLTASVVLAKVGIDFAELHRDMAAQKPEELSAEQWDAYVELVESVSGPIESVSTPGPESSRELSVIASQAVCPAPTLPPAERVNNQVSADQLGSVERRPSGCEARITSERERVLLWAEPNLWPANCYDCGHPVPAGSGHVGTVKSKGRTIVACGSCFDDQMRELHASGREF